jgi:hypothetical protein
VVDILTARPPSLNRRAFLAAHLQSLMALQEIEEGGGANDIAVVKPIIVEQAHFFTVAGRFLVLVDAQDIARAITFYNAAIDPLFDSISKQIERATILNHVNTTEGLTYTETVLRSTFKDRRKDLETNHQYCSAPDHTWAINMDRRANARFVKFWPPDASTILYIHEYDPLNNRVINDETTARTHKSYQQN